MMQTTELRDYQLSMLQDLYKAWKRTQSVMVQMPTGTGKTHLMAAVIRSLTSGPSPIGEGSICLSGKALIVAHRRELIAQISQTLDGFGVEHGLIVSGQEIDYTQKVQVASIQTLARRIDTIQGPLPKKRGRKSAADIEAEKTMLDFSLIIIDEAHHALADTYRMLWDKWPNARFLGLTATPCRLNGAPFTDLFDTLLQSWSILRFIKEGWLSDLDYVSVRAGSSVVRQIVGLDKRSVDGDFQTTQMALVLDTPESIRQLFESYKEYADGKKGIVYAINREHARHIADYYQGHGVNCCLIDSMTPQQERRKMVEDYRAGKIDVLVNVEIFSAGFDCPEVEFIQLARPTLSLSLYMQQVGRGMRISKGKSAVTILDQVGSYLLFGLPTSERNWRGMFNGKEAGKGSLQTLKRTSLQKRERTEKVLANEQMFRINSLAAERQNTENSKALPQRNGAVKGIVPSSAEEFLNPQSVYQDILRRITPLMADYSRLLVETPYYIQRTELLKALIHGESTWQRQPVGSEERRVLIILDSCSLKNVVWSQLVRPRMFGRIQELSKYMDLPLTHINVLLCGGDALRKAVKQLSVRFTPSLIIVWDTSKSKINDYVPALDAWPEAKLIGMSSAPCDNRMLTSGPLYERLVTVECDNGDCYLCKKVERKTVSLVSVPYGGITQMCMRNLKPKQDPETYVTSELLALLCKEGCIAHVYNTYMQYAQGRRGVIYAKDSHHADCIVDYFMRKGVKAELLHCYEWETLETLEPLLLKFRTGKTDVLITVGDKETDIPFPEVEFVQLAYPVQQLSTYLRMVDSGRKATESFDDDARVANSDNKLVVIDNTLMSETFGHPEMSHDWQKLFMDTLDEGKTATKQSKWNMKRQWLLDMPISEQSLATTR